MLKEMVFYEKFNKRSQSPGDAHAFKKGIFGTSFPETDSKYFRTGTL